MDNLRGRLSAKSYIIFTHVDLALQPRLYESSLGLLLDDPVKVLGGVGGK